MKNKKVLFVGQKFFGYELEIKSMLENMGATVDFHDERPSNSFWTKVFIRINAKLLVTLKIKKYYDNVFDEIKNIQYDYVFLLKVESIDEQILDKLKCSQKNAKFLLYMWDSISNYRGKEKLLPYFDNAYSFDSNDVNLYPELTLLPLFYIPTYEKMKANNIVHDLCFVGTGHSDRYRLLSMIQKNAIRLGLTFNLFIFLQSKKIFFLRRLFDDRMRKAKLDDFSFSPLTNKETLDIISQSKVVIDIEHPGQVGLTMRTIEMLGCEKKLITTNAAVLDYDFYNKNNIYILDRENVLLNKEFFETPYQKLNNDIYEKYSLKSWVTTIFSGKQL